MKKSERGSETRSLRPPPKAVPGFWFRFPVLGSFRSRPGAIEDEGRRRREHGGTKAGHLKGVLRADDKSSRKREAVL